MDFKQFLNEGKDNDSVILMDAANYAKTLIKAKRIDIISNFKHSSSYIYLKIENMDGLHKFEFEDPDDADSVETWGKINDRLLDDNSVKLKYDVADKVEAKFKDVVVNYTYDYINSRSGAEEYMNDNSTRWVFMEFRIK